MRNRNKPHFWKNHGKKIDPITFTYTFRFDNGDNKEFSVQLERKTLNLIKDKPKSPPEWTDLDHYKCPNCPLKKESHPHCPVALNIVELIDFFKEGHSYDEVQVIVETESRTFSKKTSLQYGVSSILGIFMVTSGCPILNKIRPKVRYHLPFTTLDEGAFRILSIYLLAQYFNKQKGKDPDWDLKKLTKIYEDIHLVNKSFWQRLSHIKMKDVSLNALVILDSFAGHLTFKLDEQQLSDIELLCETYFD